MRGQQLWDDLRADLRYTIRALRKSPAFTAVVIGSLALGIGANTAIFTVASQVLFDRLTIPHPEQLRLFTWTAPKSSIVRDLMDDPGPDGEHTSFPYPVYQQLRQANQVLSDLFAFKRVGNFSATIEGEAVAVRGQMVSGNYYEALQVYPTLGRPIEPLDDAVPGSGAVATISDQLWARHFGRSPSVIDRTITVNGQPITIIGVNPPDFTGAADARLSPDLIVPLSMQPLLQPQRQGSLLNDQDYWWVQIMARSKAGIPALTAQASLDAQLQSALLATAKPEDRNAFPHLVLADGSQGLNASARALTRPMDVLLALVGLVLLLACVNIANLLLARSSARRREMSIRMALGAGRARILRQVLTESLLLSLLGGAAGLALSYAGRDALPRLISPTWAQPVFNGRFDLRVFIFTAGISVLAGLLFGLVPAWKAIRTEASPELKEQTQNITSRRKGLAGNLIVSFQVALSTVLLVAAGLFVRTLLNLNSVDPGFRPDHLLLFTIQAPPSLYPPPQDLILMRRIEENVGTLPGVESVSLSAAPLISNAMSTGNFIRLDLPQGDDHSQGDAWRNAVGQSFFSTMAIPVVAGRGFNSTDTETSPKVAVINQTLAKQFFPDTDPIGKTFRGYSFVAEVPFQIVGVCADARYDSLRKQPPATYYVLYHQLPRTGGQMTYEVRTQVAPDSLVPLIRQAVQSVNKNIPLMGIRTQANQIHDTIQQEWLFAALTAGFGILAMVLTCIGVYGVMAYNVARRTREIGIRFALGAQTRGILGMILNEALRVTLAGVVVGLGVAFLLSGLVRAMLFGLTPNDPVAMVSAALLVMVVSFLAAFVPALHASRMQPIEALRRE